MVYCLREIAEENEARLKLRFVGGKEGINDIGNHPLVQCPIANPFASHYPIPTGREITGFPSPILWPAQLAQNWYSSIVYGKFLNFQLARGWRTKKLIVVNYKFSIRYNYIIKTVFSSLVIVLQHKQAR